MANGVYKATLRGVEAPASNRWCDIVPRHSPVYVLKAVAFTMARELTFRAQIQPAAAVLWYQPDELAHTLAAVFGKTVQRISLGTLTDFLQCFAN